MNRQKAIDTLMDIAKVLSKELCLNQIESSDIDCGIWDMGENKLSDHLKEEYGEMKEITFHNGVKVREKGRIWDISIELGYRFSHPQLCVFSHDGHREIMAKIELSDYEYVGDKYEHTDSYRFSEGMFWGPEGFEMQKRLMHMWQDRGGK